MKKLLSLILALAFPFQAFAATITVQPGDTLGMLASKYGTTVNQLAATNNIANPNLIHVGQSLNVGSALGASIPTVIAVYTDSLASGISSSASTFTLVRGTDKQSRSINGFYGFVIDEGTASEEFFTANCVSTACTIVARGIDVQDGSTSVTALKFSHRRGAVAKITNFPQLAILSRILNSQESTPGIIYTSSSTAIPPSAAYYATKYYVDSVGAGGFTSNNVSSTLGLQVITSGMPACPSAAACVGLYTSSTGGLAIDSAGKAYATGLFNTSTIMAGINNTFIGTTTHTGSTYVPTPSVGSTIGLAASDALVAQSVSFGQATGTAQVAITAGNALWLSATSSQLMLTSTSVASSTSQFVGFAVGTVSAGATVTYTRDGGLNCNQSGLTAGRQYYLNGTAGQISTTPGTLFARVGLAMSANCIRVMQPKFLLVGNASISATGNTVITTNFYPAHIELRAGCGTNGSNAGYGVSIGDEGNTSVNYGYNGTNQQGGADTSNAVSVYCNGATKTVGTISARDAFSFTINTSIYSGVATNIQYVATSE